MMLSSKLVVALLPLLAPLTQASNAGVYSFAEGKSSPHGLEHGAKGLACIKEMHGGDLKFLESIDTKGEELTDEHLSAAIFMVYGEKGVNNVCKFSRRLQEESNRMRSLRNKPTLNEERRTQTCSTGSAARYPSKTDPNGVYSDYMAERISKFLPDGATIDTRTNAAKMVREAQVALDDSLEGEYHAILCGTYFSGFSDLASIPDFVVFKQGPILDGINSFTCGLGQSVMQSTQASIRGLMADGMKNDMLINRAEIRATYENSVTLTDQLCSMSSELSTLMDEIEAIKAKMESGSA